VLVYDDASTEVEGRAISSICEAYSGCRLIRGVTQVGCHGARAIMFEEAQGRFIASIDADMDFTATDEHWSDRLVAMWDDRGHGIMHPLLVRPSRHVQSAGGMIGPKTGKLCLHRFEGEREDATGVDLPAKTAYCCGAFQFFHASLLDEIAQDALYTPAYFGDVDFCYRARAAGYPVWYCPEVTVIHDAGSWGSTGRSRLTLSRRNGASWSGGVMSWPRTESARTLRGRCAMRSDRR
jgi:GT2 family glycosyltransferase